MSTPLPFPYTVTEHYNGWCFNRMHNNTQSRAFDTEELASEAAWADYTKTKDNDISLQSLVSEYGVDKVVAFIKDSENGTIAAFGINQERDKLVDNYKVSFKPLPGFIAYDQRFYISDFDQLVRDGVCKILIAL